MKIVDREYSVLHLFAGMGGGALGFQAATRLHRGAATRFRCVAGIDADTEACADFERLTGAPAFHADLAGDDTRATLLRHAPPRWRRTLEATPQLTAEMLRERLPACPDVVFTSPPCKGFSGLLSKAKAQGGWYQALNHLVIDGVALVLAAWWPEVPRLVLVENVPRIQTRGAGLLLELERLLRAHGYRTDFRSHDAGELGGLAQRRRRFLVLARNEARCCRPVANVAAKPLRTVGDVLGEMPMPDDPAGGPPHRLPRLSWINWVRLALIPEGGDWRDLPGVVGTEQARREVHRRHTVQAWDREAPTVAGPGSNGVNNVADPRLPAQRGAMGNPFCYGVQAWGEPGRTVTGKAAVGTGTFAVADHRVPARGYRGVYGVVGWDGQAGTVTGSGRVACGAFAVAEPRQPHMPPVVLVPLEAVACNGTGRGNSGQFGVMAESEVAGAVTGHADIHNGRWAIADARVVVASEHPDPPPVIISPRSGKWHRPLTTLELAALQGFDWRRLAEASMAGAADGRWRERVGNAVPPPAAQAIAEVLLESLGWSGDGVFLAPTGGTGTWVHPSALALTVPRAAWRGR